MKQKNAQAKPKKAFQMTPVTYGVFVLLLVTLVAIPVVAKYIHERNEAGSVTADQFYFTSEQLKKEGAVYNLNAATETFTFTLNNFKTALQYSDMELSYTVTTTGGSFENGSAVTTTGGTLTPGAANSATLTLYGLQPGTSYTLTAVGKNGFSETLTATLHVAAAETRAYKHLDASLGHPQYVDLTVWTEFLQGDANITFPDGLLIDNTDPQMATWAPNYTGSAYVGGTRTDDDNFKSGLVYSSYTYRFFKVDPAAAFTVDDFSVVFDLTGGGTLAADPNTP